jgi:hypothetical protein
MFDEDDVGLGLDADVADTAGMPEPAFETVTVIPADVV